jgi:hypothetical protein
MATKPTIINVRGTDIAVTQRDNQQYVSLSDIASGFEGGSSLIEKWIRNKNTLEFLAAWERLNNNDFNSPEFEGIRSEAGSNRFAMSVKQWIQKTDAIGLAASAGRYGGTYAHQDIALEFCSWISPEFKLYLILEFKRLKELEAKDTDTEWAINRIMAKVNYRLQTDAIKEVILPAKGVSKEKERFVYAGEADMVNLALFGMTANQWKQANTELALKGRNIRDTASLHQLTVLSNLESYNSILIAQNYPQEARFEVLKKLAKDQLKAFQRASSNTLDKLKNPKLN